MRAIIIDDERLARKELKSLLKDYHEIEIIDECASPEEALKSIEKHNPDLLFLDIQMPEKTGFDLLQELDKSPKVVFVTAFDEYAVKAFEVNALDYLMKPVDPERLKETMAKLLSEDIEDEELYDVPDRGILSSNDQIFIKDGEKCWFIHLKDVRMFESEGNYVRIYFETFKPLVLKSLNGLEERLDQRLFFRANRKYIINLKWVSHIENWFNGGLQVVLKDGEKVEISRRQAVKFKALMSL
ncbi:MAG: response regulator [Flavobacteriales bacterium]|jgi:two-component system, LytTR family, response regulator|nr:response regulator [Flavobacteriales bacterium]MDC0338089.1 response regulator [Flavobacteriales bacterium]